jgi:peptidoglycan-associated lipoprotein
MNVRRLAIVIATAAAFAGCSTEPSQDSAASANAQNASRASAPAPAPAPAPQSSYGTASGLGLKTAPAMRSVYYDYDKAEVTAESRKVIEANAEYLRTHPGVKVVVEGNADERGSAEYNVALGQRRADGVSKIMSLLGIPSDRIETVSFGKEKPKVKGHDESSWSQNRRSDIVYR